MARVVDGVLQSPVSGGGTSFFVDPGGVDRLSTELQAASSRLFEVEQDVRSAVATVDEPSAASTIHTLGELASLTADLAATTGGVDDQVDRPLTQLAFTGPGILRLPEPGRTGTNAADLIDPLPHPAGRERSHDPGPVVPMPSRAPRPPVPGPSPFRGDFPLIPWPLFGLTDPSEATARERLDRTRGLDEVIPFVNGVTMEVRAQVQLSTKVPVPRLGPTSARGATYAVETVRTLTMQDPLGGDPFARYHVFGRTGGGGEGRTAVGRGQGRANQVVGFYQDVGFLRSPESAALDQQGALLPGRFDPALLNPGDQVFVTRLAPGDDLNSGETTYEGAYGLGGKDGTREWEGHRVSLQRLLDPAVGDGGYVLEVGDVTGERKRYELIVGLSPKQLEAFGLSATVKVLGLQVNNRNESSEGLRYVFDTAEADSQGYALARDSLHRAVALDELQFPPGTRVDDYWRHRYEQTIDAEAAAEGGISSFVGGGGLGRVTLTGSYEETESIRNLVAEANGPGGWTTYLDLGTGADTVTIQHYGVDPDLGGSVPLSVTVPGIGWTVDLGELHLGGLEPFRTTIAQDYLAGDPDTPVRVTVDALGERREFTQEQARARAHQLVADGDPRAANPVIRSLAEGESWKDAIGFSGGPGERSDFGDQMRALVGPSNQEVGEAAIAITDPVVPLMPPPAPHRAPWPEDSGGDLGIPPDWLSHQSAALGEPALWAATPASAATSFGGHSFAEAPVLDYRQADLSFADTSLAWSGLGETGGIPVSTDLAFSFPEAAFATAGTGFPGFDFGDHGDAWATTGTDLFEFDSGNLTGYGDANVLGDFGGWEGSGVASGDLGFGTADVWRFMV